MDSKLKADWIAARWQRIADHRWVKGEYLITLGHFADVGGRYRVYRDNGDGTYFASTDTLARAKQIADEDGSSKTGGPDV